MFEIKSGGPRIPYGVIFVQIRNFRLFTLGYLYKYTTGSHNGKSLSMKKQLFSEFLREFRIQIPDFL